MYKTVEINHLKKNQVQRVSKYRIVETSELKLLFTTVTYYY